MLNLQYFGHLMWRIDSLEKDADAGRDWGQEEKGTTEDELAGWHHWLYGHEFDKLWELVMDKKPGMLQSMGLQRVRHDGETELNWDTVSKTVYILKWYDIVCRKF